MQKDIQEFLNLNLKPARLTAAQAAYLMEFLEHDIPILVRENTLIPLGRPAQNATKYFLRETVEQNMRDEAWVNRATSAVYRYWLQHNAKRQKSDGETA